MKVQQIYKWIELPGTKQHNLRTREYDDSCPDAMLFALAHTHALSAQRASPSTAPWVPGPRPETGTPGTGLPPPLVNMPRPEIFSKFRSGKIDPPDGTQGGKL